MGWQRQKRSTFSILTNIWKATKSSSAERSASLMSLQREYSCVLSILFCHIMLQNTVLLVPVCFFFPYARRYYSRHLQMNKTFKPIHTNTVIYGCCVCHISGIFFNSVFPLILWVCLLCTCEPVRRRWAVHFPCHCLYCFELFSYRLFCYTELVYSLTRNDNAIFVEILHQAE